VNVKTFKNIAAVLAITALAVPAGVLAKGPTGTHGKSGESHGNSNKPHHVSQRCKHQPSVGFTLGGTLDPSSTADNMVINVTHTNHWAKPFVANKQFTVANFASPTFDGPNPFTTQGADLSKSNVQVVGKTVKLKKGCTAANSPAPTVKKVTVTSPGAAQSA
jgi:hypothetical protein